MSQDDEHVSKIAGDISKIRGKLKDVRKNLGKELRKSKEVASELRENAEKALLDMGTGKVFTDDEAAENLKNTLIDTVKAAGMTGIFLLPGGSVGLVALRKMLKSKQAEKLGIENLLTLTVEESKKAETEKHKDEEE
ncbi:MAG: hypothetical protein K1X56_13820 [Flavobacteriales bacterium]|nr:hypothetical protein [Flavobacteriales bacterium]